MSHIKIFNQSQEFTFHECRVCGINIYENGLRLDLANLLLNDAKYNYIFLTIDGLEIGKEYEHIAISITKRGKVSDISIQDLIKLLFSNQVVIYMDYYSCYSQSLLLKGTINNMEIEIIISEIKEINLFKNNELIQSFLI